MYCEYFMEICQFNNFITYKNALLSNGLLQMGSNWIQNVFLNVGVVKRKALYVRAEELNLRQLHGRRGTVGTRKEKEASISHRGKHHGYLLLWQPLEQSVMKNNVISCLAGSNTCSAGWCGNLAVLGCLQELAAIRGGSPGKSGEGYALRN